jgi:hypothetical protein
MQQTSQQSAIRARRGARPTRVGVVGLLVVLLVGIGALPASAKAPKVKMSGAVSGRSKGGALVCVETTGTRGKQLGITMAGFKVDGAKYTMSFSLQGANYAPGTYDLGASGGAAPFMQLAADRGGSRWISGPTSGTVELAKDKKHGTFEVDLTPVGGGAPVKVKGSFVCDEIVKQAAGNVPTATTPVASKSACDLLDPATVGRIVGGRPMDERPAVAGNGCIFTSTDQPNIDVTTAYPPYISQVVVSYNAPSGSLTVQGVENLFNSSRPRPPSTSRRAPAAPTRRAVGPRSCSTAA